tara:strand:- start:533 stop:1219 length:687 start_codon:yes stop_codon:yes gene_type:complete
VSHWIKVFLGALIFLTALAATGAEVVHTKWELKEEYLNLEESFKGKSNHSIKMGIGTKDISDLNLNSGSNEFALGAQSISGAQMDYEYQLSSSATLESAIYSNLGFYTKYNDLGEMGHADLSIVDLFVGASIGRAFFSLENLKLRTFAGLGHAYYYQRGDVEETNTERSGNEAEYGVGIDWLISSKDAYPQAWSSDYLLGVKYSKFNSLGQEDELSGSKVGAVFGVKL